MAVIDMVNKTIDRGKDFCINCYAPTRGMTNDEINEKIIPNLSFPCEIQIKNNKRWLVRVDKK